MAQRAGKGGCDWPAGEQMGGGAAPEGSIKKSKGCLKGRLGSEPRMKRRFDPSAASRFFHVTFSAV